MHSQLARTARALQPPAHTCMIVYSRYLSDGQRALINCSAGFTFPCLLFSSVGKCRVPHAGGPHAAETQRLVFGGAVLADAVVLGSLGLASGDDTLMLALA